VGPAPRYISRIFPGFSWEIFLSPVLGRDQPKGIFLGFFQDWGGTNGLFPGLGWDHPKGIFPGWGGTVGLNCSTEDRITRTV